MADEKSEKKSLSDIKWELSRKRNDFDKLSYLKGVLGRQYVNPLIFMPSARDNKLSLKDSFEVYKMVGELSEKREEYDEATQSYINAAEIAEKSKAPGISKKLFKKAGETIVKKYNFGRDYDDVRIRNSSFERAGEYKMLAEAYEKDSSEVHDNPLRPSTGHKFPGEVDISLLDNAAKYYEKAGDYKNAARVSEKLWKEAGQVDFDITYHGGKMHVGGDELKAVIRNLRKSGQYKELAKLYKELGKKAYTKEHPGVLSRNQEAGFYKGLADKTERSIKRRGLESKVAASIITISGLALSVLFLSGITGNVTGLSNSTSSSLGVVLFIIGILAAMFYFKRKK